MLLKATIVFLALAFSLLVLPTKSDAEPQTIPIPLTPKDYISIYADVYGVSEKQLLATAFCESNLKTSAIHYNDGGKGKHSVGIFQFQYSTFMNWSKIMGEKLDYYSYHDQIKLAAFMFSKKQGSQWTCYRKIYL